MAYGLTQSLGLAKASSQFASRADTASLSIVASFTIEGWVKPASTPGAGSGYTIASKFDSPTNQRCWNLQLDNGNSSAGSNVLFMYGDVLGDNSIPTSAYCTWSPSTGVWYHVAGALTVGTPATIALFINGVSQSITYNVQSNTVAIADGNNPTAIGTLNTLGTPVLFWDGQVSLFRLWSVVRTEAEILANMCAVLGATTNLAAEWTFDNVYTDNSGNANTLTSSGSPTFSADVPATCGSAVATARLPQLLTLGVG